jgi:long-chain acyl-CoA synthetase
MTPEGLVEHSTPRPYPFGPRTVAEILNEGLTSHPDRAALVDGARSWTWHSLDEAVRSVAGGIQPGERIWWAFGNCGESVIGALATWRAGAVWIGAPHQHGRSMLAQVQDRVGPTTLIDDRDQLPHGDVDLGPVDPHAVAAISFTSGTTGRAKAVAHSQHNLLWPGLLSSGLEPPSDGERIGTPLSLSIVNIMLLGPLSALLRGSTYVAMTNTHAEGFSADVSHHQVTRTFVVPTMLHDLVHDESIDVASLESLDRVIVGGSGVAPDLLEAFTTRFGLRPTLSYGLSEAPTGVVRESFDDPIGSGRGFPLPHVVVEILDSGGERVSVDESGEVCLRPAVSGPWAGTWTPTLGYLSEPERTAELFRGGLLHTGDIGHLDADGALSVTGRLSNLIVRGGMNVDPTAVERALTDDASVSDAVVVGVSDDRLGQRVGAVVVAEKGQIVDRAHLRESVRQALSAHAVPDVIIIAPRLARTEMGKVGRHLASELFTNGDTDLDGPVPIAP